MAGVTAKDVEDSVTELVATGVSERVLKQLEEQGLPFKRSLKLELPDFPTDITLVDDVELMSMASKYIENMNFLRTQAACAELAELESETLYKDAVGAGLLSKTTGKASEKATLLKAQVDSDPVVRELADAYSYARAYHKMIRTILDNIERYYSLTSRELTRRTSTSRVTGFNRYAP
jgi:DNA mismatch repair ATPase MutS